MLQNTSPLTVISKADSYLCKTGLCHVDDGKNGMQLQAYYEYWNKATFI